MYTKRSMVEHLRHGMQYVFVFTVLICFLLKQKHLITFPRKNCLALRSSHLLFTMLFSCLLEFAGKDLGQKMFILFAASKLKTRSILRMGTNTPASASLDVWRFFHVWQFLRNVVLSPLLVHWPLPILENILFFVFVPCAFLCLYLRTRNAKCLPMVISLTMKGAPIFMHFSATACRALQNSLMHGVGKIRQIAIESKL